MNEYSSREKLSDWLTTLCHTLQPHCCVDNPATIGAVYNEHLEA